MSTARELLGHDVALTVGTEYAHSLVTYRVRAEPTVDAPDLPGGCDADGTCEDARVPGDDAALFAQALVQATDRISLLVSARGDYVRTPFHDNRDAANDGTNAYRQLSPKVGLTYMPVASVRTYATFGVGFRAPAPLELACASAGATCPLPFSLGADPPLSPVVTRSSEVGFDYIASTGLGLTLSLFRSDVHDEIVFVTSQFAAGYFQNISRTRRQGVETSVSAPVTRALRLTATYAYIASTYESSATLASVLGDNDVTAGNDMALSPRHRASLGLEWTHTAGSYETSAAVATHMVSAQFLRGDEANREAPMSGYETTDLRARIEHGWLALNLSATNIFNREYNVYGVYADNPKGLPGSPPPAVPATERFFTPAYPRSLSFALSVHRW